MCGTPSQVTEQPLLVIEMLVLVFTLAPKCVLPEFPPPPIRMFANIIYLYEILMMICDNVKKMSCLYISNISHLYDIQSVSSLVRSPHH